MSEVLINNPDLSVIMPALNEEKNIRAAIDDTLNAFKEFGLTAEIIVVNDGSTDSTLLAAKEQQEKNPGLIRIINHDTPRGIGASFWDGVDCARGNVVCLLPADNEIQQSGLFRYFKLLADVDMVIPFVSNKQIRSFMRNTISLFYNLIIVNTFFVFLNYTNGAVLYRKSLLKELDYRSSSFFYQTDILVRLVKRGYLFVEVPYKLRLRKWGRSKSLSFFSFCRVVREYLRLVRYVYFKRGWKEKPLSPDSLSLCIREGQ